MLHLVTFMQSRLVRDERGATAVEYGLLVALIAAVIIAIVVIIGQQVNSGFNTVSDGLTDGGVVVP